MREFAEDWGEEGLEEPFGPVGPSDPCDPVRAAFEKRSGAIVKAVLRGGMTLDQAARCVEKMTKDQVSTYVRPKGARDPTITGRRSDEARQALLLDYQQSDSQIARDCTLTKQTVHGIRV